MSTSTLQESESVARDALPWATTDDGELTRTGVAVGALVGTIAVFSFLPLGILGIVLSCRGLDRIGTDRAAARRLMRWSWITMALAPVVTVLPAMLL